MPNVRARVVRGGLVLDAKAHRAERHDLLIEAGRISAIGGPGMRVPDDAEIIDAHDRLLIPGLINAHTHGHGALARAVGDRWTLELLLNAGPWISAHRSLEHKRLSALVNALEMIRKGCTACYDLYVEIPMPSVEGIAAVGSAYAEVGMRAVVAPMLATQTFYQAIPGLMEALPDAVRRDLESMRMATSDANLGVCRRLIEGWEFDRSRIKPALAPTIPLHCSDELMRASRSLASELDVGIHMHLAESKIQAVSGMRRYGKTLTAHLAGIGFLGPDFTAAHGVWLDAEDIRYLADNGCSVAHNPGSNARLGSGIAAVRELIEAGVNVGVGTDGTSCSDNQNMFEAMRFAAYLSRLRSHDYERWLGSAEVLELATEGSARVLGYAGELGRLEPGYRADITFLDRGHVNFLASNDVTNQLVNVEDGGSVDGVMVDGEVVLWHGRFTRVDLESVRRKVEQAVEELSGIGAKGRRFAEALEPHVGRFCIGLARTPYHVHSLAGNDY